MALSGTKYVVFFRHNEIMSGLGPTLFSDLLAFEIENLSEFGIEPRNLVAPQQLKNPR